MKKRKGSIPATILPVDNRESFSEVIDKVAPLVKMWQDGEVKKITMEVEAEKQYLLLDHRFKGRCRNNM